MSTGAWIVVVAVVVALAFGLWRAATDGRFRGTRAVRRPAGQAAEAAAEEAMFAQELEGGEDATVEQTALVRRARAGHA